MSDQKGPKVQYEGVAWCGWPEEAQPKVGEVFAFEPDLGPVEKIGADAHGGHLILQFAAGKLIKIPIPMVYTVTRSVIEL